MTARKIAEKRKKGRGKLESKKRGNRKQEAEKKKVGRKEMLRKITFIPPNMNEGGRKGRKFISNSFLKEQILIRTKNLFRDFQDMKPFLQIAFPFSLEKQETNFRLALICSFSWERHCLGCVRKGAISTALLNDRCGSFS